MGQCNLNDVPLPRKVLIFKLEDPLVTRQEPRELLEHFIIVSSVISAYTVGENNFSCNLVLVPKISYRSHSRVRNKK